MPKWSDWIFWISLAFFGAVFGAFTVASTGPIEFSDWQIALATGVFTGFGLLLASVITFQAAEKSARPAHVQAYSEQIKILQSHKNDIVDCMGAVHRLNKSNSQFERSINEIAEKKTHEEIDKLSLLEIMTTRELPASVDNFTFGDEYLDSAVREYRRIEIEIFDPISADGKRVDVVRYARKMTIQCARVESLLRRQKRRVDAEISEATNNLRSAFTK